MVDLGARVLYSDDYGKVTWDPQKGLVRYARTEVPFPSLDEMRARDRELQRCVAAVRTEGLALLVDVRAAPARNDDAFEAEVKRAIGALVSRFRAHAFLVKSAVGNLQARRLAVSRGDAPDSVFTSEEDALRHLGAH